MKPHAGAVVKQNLDGFFGLPVYRVKRAPKPKRGRPIAYTLTAKAERELALRDLCRDVES